jgi:hypothetical protein
VELAGGGGLNKAKGIGRTAKRRKGKANGRGKMYLPLFITELSWKPGIPRGKVSLKYDLDRKNMRVIKRAGLLLRQRDRDKDGAQTGLTFRAQYNYIGWKARQDHCLNTHTTQRKWKFFAGLQGSRQGSQTGGTGTGIEKMLRVTSRLGTGKSLTFFTVQSYISSRNLAWE